VKPPSCRRCDDTGLVLLDAHVIDVRLADGFRKTAVAYRCVCHAGAGFAKFPLVPPLPLDVLPP
jgi:hypothetical protein